MIGLSIVILHFCLALTAPLIVPYDPLEFNTASIRAAPSAEHLFGTDKLGRDIFTRTLLGGRIALLVTIIGTALAITWGGLLGITLGYLGGLVDEIILRLVDATLALPRLLVLLLIAGLFGTDTRILILALGFLYGIDVIRIARATTLDFVARDFILAAYAIGARRRTIILRELLPNVLDILLVEGALRWSWMLLAFSALSFLGFGVTPPTPDWGLMIANNRDVLALAPWATFFPIAAVSSLIIGVNLLAGALAKAIGLDRGSSTTM
jgi:peptide/nickel transport system permease protein